MLLSTQTSNIFSAFGAEEGIRVLKEAGYDALDASLFTMSTTPQSPLYGDGWKEYTEELKRLSEKENMPFNQSHVPFVFNWKNPNEFEERFMPLNIRGLIVSGILGVKTAIVHPYHYGEYFGHEEEIFERNMKFYRDLLPYAKEYGVKIAIENMWRNEPKRKYICPSACGTAKDLARYIDTLDDDTFVACLDLGHCGLVGEEAQDAIRILGHDRLKALHVHDNNYREDTHTLPMMSMMEWDEICKALADIKYDGDFTFEADAFLRYVPKDFKPTACKFMADTGRYLISKIESHMQNN
jgi:sugar phosphate isomerase/epimerase